MTYLGSPPASQFFAPGTDTFSGTGSQTAFTLSRNVATSNDILVIVNNVEQQPSNYTVLNNILTFSPAPSAGTNNIYVRYLSTNLQTIAPQQGSVYPSSLSTQNAVYWDTSGNVGIGTTAPGAYKLNVNGASVNIGAIGTGNPSLQAVTTDAAGISYLALQNGTRNYSIRDEGTAGALTFRDDTAVAERMRIDSNGNVGIGGAPTYKLDVIGSVNSNIVSRILNNNTGASTQSILQIGTGASSERYINLNVNYTNQYFQNAGNNITAYYQDYDTHYFRNNAGTLRMTLDSSGNLLVGTSSTVQSALLSALSTTTTAGFRTSAAAGSGLAIDVSRTSATGDMVYFRTSSTTLAGYITCPTGTTTSYASVSDYRLKENIAPMTGALDVVAQLKPCAYKWKSTGEDGQGFIAHELQAVVPDAVIGEKDAVNQDGSIKPQAIDTSFLVATLTAAIQEQQAMIEELKTKVAALEAR